MGKAYMYIMGNTTGTIYIGVTNDLERRVFEHKNKLIAAFSRKYSTTRLLFFEEFNHLVDAMTAEKKVKGWRRKKKLDLIRTINATFRDLSEDWESG